MEYLHGGDIYTYEGVTDYSVNLNPLGPSEQMLAALRESLTHAGEYPDSRCSALRRALAADLGIPEDFLIFGNGAAELIFLAAWALKPKKAVLTLPAFTEYRRALVSAGCGFITDDRMREENHFRLEESYLELLTDDVDMIILCSPDNPSGGVIPKDLLVRIVKKCSEHQIMMVLDECFVEFLDEPEKQTLLQECFGTGQLLILRAFTKISAVPGVRIGYAVTSNRELLEKMEENRQPWSVSCVAQAAGLAALGEKERWEETRELIRKERAWLEGQLTQIGAEWFPSEVNYILLKSPYPLFELLLEQKLLIRDCSNYKGLTKGYYRIAVRTRQDNEKLVRALARIYGSKEQCPCSGTEE